MKAIRFVTRALVKIEYAALAVLFSALLVLAFTQIALRNFFSTSLLWADPLMRQLVLWTGFLGAAIGVDKGRHIKLDLFDRFAGPAAAKFTHAFTGMFASVICGFLTHASWVFVLSEREAGDELFNAGGVSYPVWWFQTIIPIGFALLALHFLLKAVEHLLSPATPHSAANDQSGAAGGETP